MSAGSLSDIMKNRRKVSAKMALSIVRKLNLPQEELKAFEQLVGQIPESARLLLPEEAFELASHWYYPAIICLFELDSPPRSTTEISRQLKIPLSTAHQAVERLLHFGFLKTLEDGSLEGAKIFFKTSEDVPVEAFRQAQIESFEIAARALREIDVNERESTLVIFDGSPSQISEAKAEIRHFRDQLVPIMQSERRDRVYALSIQLVPLSIEKSDS